MIKENKITIVTLLLDLKKSSFLEKYHYIGGENNEKNEKKRKYSGKENLNKKARIVQKTNNKK